MLTDFQVVCLKNATAKITELKYKKITITSHLLKRQQRKVIWNDHTKKNLCLYTTTQQRSLMTLTEETKKEEVMLSDNAHIISISLETP